MEGGRALPGTAMAGLSHPSTAILGEFPHQGETLLHYKILSNFHENASIKKTFCVTTKPETGGRARQQSRVRCLCQSDGASAVPMQSLCPEAASHSRGIPLRPALVLGYRGETTLHL